MFFLKRRSGTSLRRWEFKTVADPDVLDPGSEYSDKETHGNEDSRGLTDLRDRVGAHYWRETLGAGGDQPVLRRQIAVSHGEVEKRTGARDNDWDMPGNTGSQAASVMSETVVDLHMDLFDIRHLPLDRILKENGVPGCVAGPAKRLFDLLAGKADFAAGPQRAVVDGVGELEGLQSLADLLTMLVAKEMAERILSKEVVRPEHWILAEDAGQHQLRSDELLVVLEEIEALAWPGMPADFAHCQLGGLKNLIDEDQGASFQTDTERLEKFEKWVSRRFSGSLLWFLEILTSTNRGDAGGTPLDYARFFLLMLSKEADLREILFSGFGVNQNEESVFRVMRETPEAQSAKGPNIRLLGKSNTKMETVTEDRLRNLVGFVAFDVRRTDGMRIVKYSGRDGASGVNVNPSMVDPACGIGATQQERSGALISHCAGVGFPILTHCSPVSLEVIEGQNNVSDPDYWLKILDDCRDLRLCYGHAGGGGESIVDRETGSEVLYYGWCSQSQEEWADDHNFSSKVVEQCCRFPNVFCDFSYFGPIVKNREKAIHLKRNLITALGGPNGDLHFGRKIMFGSDWHMPKMAEHASDLLAYWREVFDDPLIVQHRDAFFFKNALRFLRPKSLAERPLR